jgi:predicted dehydrogenase
VTTTRTIGVVMNGVTGRMGYRQHLVRSVLAIREAGGVRLADGSLLVPEPILVGRSAAKLAELAARHGLARWTTELGEALAEPDVEIYFDAQVTSAREKALAEAVAAGRHVYTEKPVGSTLAGAASLAHLVHQAGVTCGVVHDKLFLPGIITLRRLLDEGFFGQVLSVRGEFGYWVFDGEHRPAQRPSWNYRAEDGGGIVVDMFCHWSYLLEHLFGRVRSVNALAVTHVPTRWDGGLSYRATADDAAYAVFELDGGVVAQINSSWCTRVHRDELFEFQVDGTAGSAVAGLRGCRVQPAATTPAPVWNPDQPVAERYRDQWIEVPQGPEPDNGFKAQWELFLRHVADGVPFPYDIESGVRGVQLADLGLRSSAQGRRLEVPGPDAAGPWAAGR